MKLTWASGTLSLAILGVVASSPAALAEDSGWYLGGNVGVSRSRIDDEKITRDLLGAGFVTTSISDDERDLGYKIFGGYQFNKYFALEGGYFDLGKFSFTANTLPPGTLSGDIKLRGLNFDVVGILPITERFSAFGRGGVNYAEARDSFQGTGAVTVTEPDRRKRTANYKFGAGLQYNITESLSLRAEAERYRIDDAVGNKGDVDLFSVGLVYRFFDRTPVAVAAVHSSAPEPQPQAEPIVHAAPIQSVPALPLMKVAFSADSLFDFNKANVKPAGKLALDKLATDLHGVDYDSITVTGHTDRIGTHQYNMKLSAQRAEAVKNYLVNNAGIAAGKISVTGVNGSDPVTKSGECIGTKKTKKLITCLQPDRRVEVEVTGTK